LTPSEVTRDPRARRAAIAARRRGFDVAAVSGQVSGAEPLPLEHVRVERLRRERVAASLRGLGLGGATRPGLVTRELRGLFRLARLTRLSAGLAAAGRRLGSFDVVHANDLETLAAGWLLARRSGARLVYDAHELYSSSEPDYPRVYGAVAGLLERRLARRASVVTVSKPIADEMEARLRLPCKPIVVMNCPDRQDVAASARDGPLRAVYQGAMGISRPLDDLLVAAAAAIDVTFTIRVANAPLQALRERVSERGLGDRVEVVDPVQPTDLVNALAPFEVGLVINRPLTRNDELVLPNKLFEYFMAGLAVVVPRLPGMAPLVEEEGIGLTFEPGDPTSLAAALRELAADGARLDDMRQRARRLAIERFNSDAQAEALIDAWGLA
jgi:glycosyltransferase involved in cell wall biosynthesis